MTTITRQRSPRPSAAEVPDAPPVLVSGILDVGDSKALIRASGYEPCPDDISLTLAQVRQHGLRRGDYIEGTVQLAGQGRTREKNAVLTRLDAVNRADPSQAR